MMLKKLFSWCLLLGFYLSGLAQEESPKRTYVKTAGEIIFSAGVLEIQGAQVDPVVRFSAFFQSQEQLHIDISKNIGIYTGIGSRNIGFINRINDSIRIKQRVYSIGIPLALKIGNMRYGNFLAIGGEAEFFTQYKQKTFLNQRQNKVDKFSEWFSNRVNVFNPSVFAEYNFDGKRYIRLRYYLNDFLVSNKQSYRLSGGSAEIPFIAERSTLFYISFGTTLGKRR
ncbi:MAG: hypothetical protein ACK4GL_07810 [Flavobacteriales bacterium]